MREIEPAGDRSLRYIENASYRGRMIKIARRGDDLKILIYAPGQILASEIVEAQVAHNESPIMLAKAKIDHSLSAKPVGRILTGFIEVFELDR